MKEFSFTDENHAKVSESANEYLNEILDAGGSANMTISSASDYVGKWGMVKLWRSWVATCSKFMNVNGATMPLFMDKDGNPVGKRPFNSDDGHELFTIKMLGQHEGFRLSWARKDHDGMISANQGQRLHAMNQLHEWATERGITLYNPRDSHYQELVNRQNS